jgi:heme exporter protein A
MTAGNIIRASNLAKKYSGPYIFRDISLSLEAGDSIAITGPNGSGKSTLLEIIAGIKRQTSGTVEYSVGGERIGAQEFLKRSGFLSPRMNLYNELTAVEMIGFISGSMNLNINEPEGLLGNFGLAGQVNKKISEYSSGMKQRLKFMLSVIHDPCFLLLDEPTSHLDSAGRDMIFTRLDSERKNKIIIIATNEESEASFCGRRIGLV